jgi:hypothetical protein
MAGIFSNFILSHQPFPSFVSMMPNPSGNRLLSVRPFFLIIKYMRKPDFEEFEATSLYCPRCKAATPVRKKLLLVLPEGDEYEYLCVHCSSSVGTKIDKNAPPLELLLKP